MVIFQQSLCDRLPEGSSQQINTSIYSIESWLVLMMGSLFHGLFHNPHTTGYSRNDIKNPDFNAALFRVLKVDGSWSLFFEG